MALAALSAVYLHNSSLFKPWYLTGQVEVYCLMSSMWLQSGMCAADRRLCPVSDWGLGLVTGPGLIGWLVPPQPAHAPSLSARREAGSRRCERPRRQGWKDRLGAWMDCFHSVREHTNTRSSSSRSASPEPSRLRLADSHSRARFAQRLIFREAHCGARAEVG